MPQLPSGTVTFLFTDVEGSTRLWEQHPDAMKPALARHDEILRVAVTAGGGAIVKTTGDGLHAVFSTAVDAVAAAVDAQRALLAESWDPDVSVRVRMGIHTGSAEERDGDYYGPAVNKAARVAAAAHGGQIVVSHVTEELARSELADDVTLVDLGVHQLRDLARAERVLQVTAPGLPRDFPPLRSTDSFPTNLPVQLSSFIGRDDELAKVQRAVRACRLVTLTGVGGVGKTRLAVQAAADVLPEHADGVWLCELAAATDGTAMVEVVAAALGVNPRPGVTLEQSVVEHLRGREVLLVLDNCEHLIDEAGALAVSLLRECPDLRILATSREGLGVDGEQIRVVRSLGLPSDDRAVTDSEAVRLFLDRASAARPDQQFDDTQLRMVGEVCQRLDGIPLAIELAAARTVALAPSDILRRLDERFRLLTGGRRTSVERHHTLRATVDWSYSLLEPVTARVFDRLGAFYGSFDADAAEAVAADDGVEAWDVLDAVSDLVAKSMLVADPVDGTIRYSLLETLRQYARERLDEAGESDAVRRRHAEHYAAIMQHLGVIVAGGPDERVGMRQLERELDNVRAAVTWALDRTEVDDQRIGLQIIGSLGPASLMNRSLGIGGWAEQAVAVVEVADPPTRASVLSAAGESMRCQRRNEEALAFARRALDGGVAVSPMATVLALTTIGAIGGMDGDVRGAVDMVLAARDELRAEGPHRLADAWLTGNAAAWATYDDERQALAWSLVDEALAMARLAGSQALLASCLFVRANLLATQDRVEALACYEESVELTNQQSNSSTRGIALACAGRLWQLTGDTRRGLQRAIDSIEFLRDDSDQSSYVGALRLATATLVELGRPEMAAEVLGVYDGDVADHLGGGFREIGLVDEHPLAETAETALGAERFAAMFARGRSSSLDEVADRVVAELRRQLVDRESELSLRAAP